MAKADNVNETNDGWETIVEPYGDTFPFENPGDTLQGIYKSSKLVSQPDMNDPSKMREAPVYEVEDETGKRWSVWGSYAIDQAFETIEPGKEVRIAFEGKVSIDGGKRTVKQFKVQTR